MREFNLFIKMLDLAIKNNSNYRNFLKDLLPSKSISANIPLKLAIIIEICKEYNYKAEIGACLDADNLIYLEDYINNTDSLDISTSSILDLQKNLNGNQIIFTNHDQTNTVIFYQISEGDF